MSKRTTSHSSANGLFAEMIKQDVQYWKKRCKVPCQDCYLIRCGRRIDEIHEHYRKIGSEYCTSIFSSQKGEAATVRDKIDHKIEPDHEFEMPAVSRELQNDNAATMSRAERNLYIDVLRCCKEPTLVRSERISTPKDKFRDDSERLSSYAGEVFNLHPRCHEQYQLLIQTETQKESLLQQLDLLETNSHPFYNERNFETFMEYKHWQDYERKAIWMHLENSKSPPSRGKCGRSGKDRRDQYRRLAEKVFKHDLATVKNLASSTSTVSCTVNQIILGKHGRRLLAEFAERFRVSRMSRLCCHLEVLYGCLEMNISRLNTILSSSIEHEIKDIINLLNNGDSLCVSDGESICGIADNLSRIAHDRVTSLLTEWIPTPKVLETILKLTETTFHLVELLHDDEDDDSIEWPECLSDWLHCAIQKKYHSYKETHCKETSEMFFFSVEYAVDVLKLLKRREQGNLSYEGVLNKYIPDFVDVFMRGIYESVEADETALANTLTSGISVQVTPEEYGRDALNLRDMALSYKLAEFDKIARVNTGVMKKQPRVSWRIAYHPVAMHWLDILSCHMRRQVNEVVKVEKECGTGPGLVASNLRRGCRPNSCDDSFNVPSTVTSPKASPSRKCLDIAEAKGRVVLHCMQNNNPLSHKSNSTRRKVAKPFFGTICDDHSSNSVNSLHSPSNHFPSNQQSTSTSSFDSSTGELDGLSTSSTCHSDTLPELIMVDENFNGISNCSDGSATLPFGDEQCGNIQDDSKDAITTSLADFTSIMTRFIQVVKDVTATIYVLPCGVDGDNDSWQEGDMTEERASLKNHKNHFLLKAIEALCYGAQQYVTLILQKQLGRGTTNAILKGEIAGDSFRRTNRHSAFKKNLSIDQIFRHFNNLLVLQSGLPHAIFMLESLIVPPCVQDLEDDRSTFCSGGTTDDSNSMGGSSGDDECVDSRQYCGGLSVLSTYLKEDMKDLLNLSVERLGKILTQCLVKDFLTTFSNCLHALPMTQYQFDVNITEVSSRLENVLERIEQDCYEEGLTLLHRTIWIAIMENFQLNTHLLLLSGRFRYDIQCKYHLKVFGVVANTFCKRARQGSYKGIESLDMDLIKPTLEMVELLSMPTPSLISMLEDEDHDVEPFINLCMNQLQNKKSFTGAELRRAVIEVNLTDGFSSHNNEMEICQRLLTSNVVKFLFRKKRVEKLPDIISEEMAVSSSPERSDSLWSSRQSSINTEDTDSGESNSSDFERIFFSDNKTIYRFADNTRMFFPSVCLKDHPENSEPKCGCVHVIDVLRYKSSSDNRAKKYLRKDENIVRTWLPCMS